MDHLSWNAQSDGEHVVLPSKMILLIERKSGARKTEGRGVDIEYRLNSRPQYNIQCSHVCSPLPFLSSFFSSHFINGHIWSTCIRCWYSMLCAFVIVITGNRFNVIRLTINKLIIRCRFWWQPHTHTRRIHWSLISIGRMAVQWCVKLPLLSCRRLRRFLPPLLPINNNNNSNNWWILVHL